MSDRRSDADHPSLHLTSLGGGSARPSTARGTLVAGRYAVERMLGRGGMASVYLAHDRLVDRPVAIKILRRELAHSASMERFTREIGVIGRLRHAHIVPLHDSGVYDELPFYVMAYIEGESLQERLVREGALPIADVVRFGEQVAEALAYAHREGVLHRDVTPGNILFADGNAYVADFGIARLFNESTQARTTQTGFILGTPSYMSPEQASGEMECDGRSDIYSLGCVLYEATTGAPPFVGPTPQAVIAGHFGSPPPQVRTVRADAPLALSDAIARAMKSTPADRFQTATELCHALAAASPPQGLRLRARGAGGHLRRAAMFAALLASAALGTCYVAGSRWAPLRLQLDRLAMRRAQELVADGEWARADTALRGIVEHDPANATAHVWLAQVGALSSTMAQEPSDAWKAEVTLAEQHRATLDTVARLQLEALRGVADGAYDVARDRYRRVVAAKPASVVMRLALADAYLNDSVVEPDPSSPSGWRFRGSWHGAASTLRSALEMRPDAAAIRGAAYDRLTRVLITSSRYRPGRSTAGGERSFVGFPALDADSLAYVPYPLAQVESGIAESRNTTLPDVQSRNREALRRLAEEWVADLPDDAAAHRAYATALAAVGVLTSPRPDAANAVGEIRRARELSRDDRSRLFTGAQEVRLLIRARRLGEARALADTLMARSTPRATDEIQVLAALAALRGNAARAIAFLGMSTDAWTVRLSDGRPWTIPAAVVPHWAAVDVYSAVGRQADSIIASRDRLEAVVRRDVAPDLIPVVRTSLLMRPLILAAPAVGAGVLANLEPGKNLFAGLIRHVATGDTAALRRGLHAIDTLRRARDAASLSIDGAYLLAWLRLAAADTAGAERQMDTVLEQLHALTDGPPIDRIGSALVVRLMRLRGEVAARRGDQGTALRWRAAADTLWR